MTGTFGSINRDTVKSVSGVGLISTSLDIGDVIVGMLPGDPGQYITTDGVITAWDDFPSIPPNTPNIARAIGVTESNGQVTFNWPLDVFSSPPVVTLAIQGSNAFRSCRIAANSASSTTAHVLVSAGVTVLGIGVLAVGADAPGVTVHAIAIESN